MDQLLLGLFNLINLTHDKLLLPANVVLDVFLQQIDGLALVVRDLLDQIREALDVLEGRQVNVVIVALVDEVLQAPLRLFHHSNLARVRQLEWTGLLVQVKELHQAQSTKLGHYNRGVVFRHCQLVKLHEFRSKEWLGMFRDN